MRTTHGSAAFGDWVPDHDAPHVARLRVFNVTGQPAITIPVGEMTGVQIVAAPGRDDLVLSVGAQLERALR